MPILDPPPNTPTFSFKLFKDWLYKLWKYVTGGVFGTGGGSSYSNALAKANGLLSDNGISYFFPNPQLNVPLVPTARCYGQSSSQTVATATWTTLTTWANVAGDSYGAMNASTGVYTVPVSGLYLIIAQCSYTSSVNSWAAGNVVAGVGFASNGTISEPQSYTRIITSTTSYVGAMQTPMMSTFLRLSVGTQITIQTYQNTGGNATTENNATGANHTCFFIYMIATN